jgi:predicted lipoprotein with Yx(FWY)xxD motif
MPGYGVPGYGKPGYGKARPMMGGHGSPAKGGYGAPAAGYGAAPSGGTAAGSASGAVVTDAEGMTLYTYAQDEQGISNCYDACARSWPPVLAGELESLGEDMSLIERRDGTEQVALEGMPLYRWAGDSEPGDMTGDGVGGVWDVARR